ncbi:MAG TPA: hypothetical protein VHR66_00875, partial [Gemmataceae bacterium]|nr:hypothetical protein [Gemmataceae bacterium]
EFGLMQDLPQTRIETPIHGRSFRGENIDGSDCGRRTSAPSRRHTVEVAGFVRIQLLEPAHLLNSYESSYAMLAG